MQDGVWQGRCVVRQLKTEEHRAGDRAKEQCCKRETKGETQNYLPGTAIGACKGSGRKSGRNAGAARNWGELTAA